MAMNKVQFQRGLSMLEFFDLYGTQAQCDDVGRQGSCPRCFAKGTQSQRTGDGCRKAQGPVEAMIVQSGAGVLVTSGRSVASASIVATAGSAPLKAPLRSLTSATKSGPATPAAPHAVKIAP